VTIEDPLVSRHHASIDVDGDRAVLHDLGSRNGIKLNGRRLSEPTALKDGDRIRIGTQEVVFCVGASDVSPRSTGNLRRCSRCRMTYAEEAPICPTCGASVSDDETLSGQVAPGVRSPWSLDVFLAVLERAGALDRFDDVSQILPRLRAKIDERLSRWDALDPEELARVARVAMRLSLASSDPTWGTWVAGIYRRVPSFVPEDVIAQLGELSARFPTEMADPLKQLAAHCRLLSVSSSDDARALAALEALFSGSRDSSS
jgi:hypothetical protein